MARELTVMPAVDVVQPMTQPLLSSLSQVREDHRRVTRQLKIATLLIAVVTAPACAFLYVFSELVIVTLLGTRWHDAAPLMGAMTPLLFSYAVGGLVNNLFLALGRTRDLFRYDAISLTLIILVVLAFRNADLESLLLARSLLGFLITMTVFAWIARSVGASAGNLMALCLAPAMISLIAVSLVPRLDSGSAVLDLIGSGLAMAAVYVPTVVAFAYVSRRRSDSWGRLFELAHSSAKRLRRATS